MPTLLVTEARLYRTGPRGPICCRTGTRDYQFWRQYQELLGDVVVAARVAESDGTMGAPVEGPGVTVEALPDYVGPAGFLQRAPSLLRILARACSRADLVVVRSPGLVAWLAGLAATWGESRTVVEVVGDPAGSIRFAGGQFGLGRLTARFGAAAQRWLCRRALGAAYVTQHSLQQFYPPAPEAATGSYSSVVLGDEDFVGGSRIYHTRPARPFAVVCVANFSQPYKGQTELLRALRLARDLGAEIRATFVGGGRYLEASRNLALALGVRDQVQFLGSVRRAAVKSALDDADLFVLPSLAGEGLPRVILEAMARGLPCIATAVGGVAEVVPADGLVTPGDVKALAAKLVACASNAEALSTQSRRNLAKAREFDVALVQARRRSFYQDVLRLRPSTRKACA